MPAIILSYSSRPRPSFGHFEAVPPPSKELLFFGRTFSCAAFRALNAFRAFSRSGRLFYSSFSAFARPPASPFFFVTAQKMKSADNYYPHFKLFKGPVTREDFFVQFPVALSN